MRCPIRAPPRCTTQPFPSRPILGAASSSQLMALPRHDVQLGSAVLWSESQFLRTSCRTRWRAFSRQKQIQSAGQTRDEWAPPNCHRAASLEDPRTRQNTQRSSRELGAANQRPACVTNIQLLGVIAPRAFAPSQKHRRERDSCAFNRQGEKFARDEFQDWRPCDKFDASMSTLSVCYLLSLLE